jgi:hypothetical protein
MLPIDDPDVWWRFRSGRRIAEHHAVAVQDFFSSYEMGKPWIDIVGSLRRCFMERAVIQSSRSGLLCNHDGAHHHFPGAPTRPPCRVAVFR